MTFDDLVAKAEEEAQSAMLGIATFARERLAVFQIIDELRSRVTALEAALGSHVGVAASTAEPPIAATATSETVASEGHAS